KGGSLCSRQQGGIFMKYGPLGRSGLIVSRICLGGNSWGAKGNRGWGKFDEVEAPAYFKRALDVGITFFDTADAYNAGRSEEIMGATLVKMTKRENFVLSTKVGIRMSNTENDVGTGRKHLMAAIDEQLRRLQTDYIDVYQVHRLDPHTPIEETMYTLDQIVRSGKVRYIGGSTMPAYKFAQMIMLADWKGYSRPIAMQNLYNLIQREEENEMNRLCHEQGVGLIPYSPLARGFLAGNRSREGGGATERSKNDVQVRAGTYRDCDWEIVERVKKVALGKNASPAQTALAWLLSKPYMGSPIIGATDLDQLSSAAKSTEIALTVDECKLLEEPYQPRLSPVN
ncbi:MAG: aldo/keto reductase, partial [Reyranella sp.]|uniref:aldo/keto reductase n=2 Tax=Reyranella sp. TaxID=1929291 RepID=UPI003D13ABA9